MKKTKCYFLSLMFALLCLATAHAGDADDVKQVFINYLEAATQSQGDKVVQLFSESSMSYWDQRLNEAKGLPREELLKRPTYQLFNVILIRKRIADDPKVAQMGGHEWLRHSYNQGWNSKKALNLVYQNKQDFEFIAEVNGDTAELKIKTRGTVLPDTFPFIKAGGIWKIDGGKQFVRLEENIEKKRQAEGLEKIAFVEALYQKYTLSPIPESLWQPLKK